MPVFSRVEGKQHISGARPVFGTKRITVNNNILLFLTPVSEKSHSVFSSSVYDSISQDMSYILIWQHKSIINISKILSSCFE